MERSIDTVAKFVEALAPTFPELQNARMGTGFQFSFCAEVVIEEVEVTFHLAVNAGDRWNAWYDASTALAAHTAVIGADSGHGAIEEFAAKLPQA